MFKKILRFVKKIPEIIKRIAGIMEEVRELNKIITRLDAEKEQDSKEASQRLENLINNAMRGVTEYIEMAKDGSESAQREIKNNLVEIEERIGLKYCNNLAALADRISKVDDQCLNLREELRKEINTAESKINSATDENQESDTQAQP